MERPTFAERTRAAYVAYVKLPDLKRNAEKGRDLL
jgi:hypothetical protein